MTAGSRDTTQDMAAFWVARMDSGQWSAADEAELQAWLAADPRRHGVLLQTHASWAALDAATTTALVEPLPETGTADAAPRWRRRGVIGGIAAAGIAAIGATAWIDRGVALKTNLGEIRRMPLVDGSVVTINSASTLKVRMERNARKIELAEGEAWFEVAKDAKRPFIVSAGGVRAQAIGTAFSVRMRDSGVDVLVTEGVVETWPDQDEAPRVRLTAGERAFINDHTFVHYTAEKASTVDRALAWRSGMIDLNGTTLTDAAEEFNRYNARKIIITDPRIAGEQFDGLFRIDDPEGFAEALKSSLGATVNTDDPRYIRIQH